MSEQASKEQVNNKRVSNQTADGSAPKQQQDYRKHDWAITTTIEVDGKIYVMPVQVLPIITNYLQG